MTNAQLAAVWPEVDAYTDKDAFVSDLALSSLFATDPESPVDMDLVSLLQQIWDVYHMSIADMRHTTGLSQRAFAESLMIPYRTIQNWEGRGGCPEYTRVMIARCIGLISISLSNEHKA